MIDSQNIWIISSSVVLIGAIIYCIRQIEQDADDDDSSISELLV
jgi:hypothetical protein